MPLEALTTGETEAVDEINRIFRNGAVNTLEDLGRYVLARFYADDAAQYGARGEKDASLAKVAADPRCEVSVSTLARGVGIYLMFEAQPELRELGLSPTHHRALLTVDVPARRMDLARQAKDQGIPGPVFEKMLASPSRKRTSHRPEWAQKRARVSASIRSQMRHPPSREAFAGLSRSEAQKTLSAMERDATAYAAYVAEMRRQYDEILGTHDGLEVVRGPAGGR